MTIKVAINGFGRIGRNILRAHYEGGKKHALQFVAINDLGDAKTNAHLLRYDTAHGSFPGTVEVKDKSLAVNGDATDSTTAFRHTITSLRGSSEVQLAVQRGRAQYRLTLPLE